MSIDSIISLILADKRLSALRKKIVSGKGTFSDTFDYTSYSANLMGQLFSGEVLDMPEEERKSTCISLLRDRYTDINALLDTTQRTLDKAQGLALTPRHVPFDEERAAQIGDSLTDKTVPDETIVRRAGSAPVTAVRSMHDDYIEENAEFRSKAGLQCYINRVTDGKCCKWCSKMAGRFEYGDEPDGIFRRHDNCGCSVTYECGRQRQNVWTKKTWEVPETDAGAPPPTVFSQEQARKKEQEKLAQIVHKPSIDKLAESGIIESRNMANGGRRSRSYVLTTDDIAFVNNEAEAIGIPTDILVFNSGNQTGFRDSDTRIYIRGDIFPDNNSNKNRDLLSVRATLAHEYYGHYKAHPSPYDIGDWRDEFNASYRAAIDTPNLSDEDRARLMIDAYERAEEAGQKQEYDEIARRLIYGY